MAAATKIRRIDRAIEALEPQEEDCALCPRACHVDRRRGKRGVCRTGDRAGVSQALLHFGEEPVLSGVSDCAAVTPGQHRPKQGSGTIFFTGCNLKCLFCQNYQISWLGQGRELSDEELADEMLSLGKQGAWNINLVSPTHVIVPVLRALKIACAAGLDLPIVWNSNGYEKAKIIERLRGVVDVYLPDLKYVSPAVSKRYSAAPDYFDHAGPTLQEMFIQKPDLVLDDSGMALQGLLVRHLILPGHGNDSVAVLEWLARALTPAVSVSLMSQYRPCFRAPDELRRTLSVEEYRMVADRARELGFENLFLQPGILGTEDHLLPDFSRVNPFRWK
jgi:putative pyruvate formate lyase activating enzyme